MITARNLHHARIIHSVGQAGRLLSIYASTAFPVEAGTAAWASAAGSNSMCLLSVDPTIPPRDVPEGLSLVCLYAAKAKGFCTSHANGVKSAL